MRSLILAFLSLLISFINADFNGRGLNRGLPKFIAQPKSNYYIVKGKSVTITCKAINAGQIVFMCAKQWMRDGRHTNLQLTEGGNKVYQTSITVTKDEIKEYYGMGGFYCLCNAWLTPGAKSEPVKSIPARIQIATLKKRFQREPISTKMEQSKSVQLSCLPPDGLPQPTVFWMKDNVVIDVKKDINYIISNEGNLLINQARLEDSGKYRCGALNAASRRISEAATLTIFVNGVWSSWTAWTQCSSKCGKGTQRRTRVCNNPPPQNNGSRCTGDSFERTVCTNRCPVAGNWGEWSSWSTCSPECKYYRRRQCDNPAPVYSGMYCKGHNLDTNNCTGGMCRDKNYYTHPKEPPSYPEQSEDQSEQSHHNGGMRKKSSNYPNEQSHSGAVNKDNNNDIAMYVGICIGFTIIVTIIIIVFFAVRRKHLPRQPDVNISPLDDDDEKKVHIQCQVDMISTQPDLMQNVGTLRSQSSDTSNPNNNHIDSSDKVPIYSEIVQHRLSASLGKNGKALMMDPCVNHNLKKDSIEKLAIKDKSSLSMSPTETRPLLQNGDCTHTTASDYMPQLPSNIDIDSVTWRTFDNKGGRLILGDSGICLTVSEGAIKKGQCEELYLAICHDVEDRPKLSDRQTLISPVILIGPPTAMLKKPIVLTSPHCASMRQGGWVLSVYTSDSDIDDPPQWQKTVTLGQETINTPIYTQLDPNHCHLMTDQLQRYVLVGESALPKRAVKVLRLAAFAPSTPPSMDYGIRVYVVDDSSDSLESVFKVERKLGGQLLDKPKQILFQDGGNNLCLSIEEVLPGWRSKPAANYQEIPFRHIWSGNQTNLHCSFSLELVDVQQEMISCLIQVYQKGILSNRQCINVTSDLRDVSSLPPTPPGQSTPTRQSSLSVSSNGINGYNHTSSNETLCSNFRLSPRVRSQLCLLLDTPNPRGNDWRMLAQALTVDRYINYFATKPSPTEHILDLWEARHREDTAVTHLLNILRVIGRLDASAVIEKEVGPWL